MKNHWLHKNDDAISLQKMAEEGTELYFIYPYQYVQNEQCDVRWEFGNLTAFEPFKHKNPLFITGTIVTPDGMTVFFQNEDESFKCDDPRVISVSYSSYLNRIQIIWENRPATCHIVCNYEYVCGSDNH